MKTLTRAIVALVFLALGVWSSAAQPAFKTFPVGDTNYFLKSGAALVRDIDWGFGYTDAQTNAVDLVGSPDPLGYPSPGNSPENLVRIAKERIIQYFAGETNTAPVPGYLNTPLPQQFAAHHAERYWLWVQWYAPIGNDYPPIFLYETRFHLVQGADGKWTPPDWVLDTMSLGEGGLDYSIVLLRLPNLYGARVRWWDGHGFSDTGVPYYPSTAKSKAGIASSTNNPSYLITDPSTGTVALPASPILGKAVGVITLVFGDGKMVRYLTRDGAQLPPSDREPLITAIIPWPGAVKIIPSGDYSDISEIIFERSSGDLTSWKTITGNGDGVLDRDGMRLGLFRLTSREFFRARYR